MAKKHSSKKSVSKNTIKKGVKNDISKTDKKIYITILVIAIICTIISVLVLNEKTYYETGEKSLCTVITDGNGCQTVQTSKYANIFGIKNPYYGIVGYPILGILALVLIFRNIPLFKLGIVVAGYLSGIMALWFLYVQTFVLKIYCVFCVFIDIFSLTLLSISIYYTMKHFRKK